VCQLNAMRHSYDHGALLVHGASGAGKSSVVRAGVYPKLKISADWIVAPLFKTPSQPWESILQSLSHSLLCGGIDEDKIAPAIREIDIGVQENRDISLDHLSVLLGNRTLLFIVDNLDRYCLAQTSQTDRLFSLLRCAIRAPSINVLGVFRSDRLQQVRQALAVSYTDCNFMSIAVPDPKILMSSLNQLLVDKGYDFDPNLIYSLFVDVGSQMEAWPLVGRCFYNLWNTAADKRLAFKLQNYCDSGGIRNQIEADLAIIESRLGRELEEFFEFLAFEGVSHVEGTVVVPRPIPSARIPQEYQNAIDLLVKNFLFVAGGNRLTGEGAIEIIPNLIETYWGNAQIARRALAMEELREAARAARHWKLKDRQPEWLVHRGNRLASAIRLTETKKLTDSELRAYLSECKRHFQ
jgi:conflict system STAND superfamily ATPase